MGMYGSLIERLVQEQEEVYEERSLLLLCQAYVLSGDEKSARKTVRRLLRLFPSGECVFQAEELADALEGGELEAYKERLLTRLPPELKEEEPVIRRPGPTATGPTATGPTATGPTAAGLSNLYRQTRKQERPPHIPESIRECFEGVIGLESVQKDLNQFYMKLRFQNERQQSDFRAKLLPVTHFAVVGERGCGKTMVGELIASLLYDFGVRDRAQAVRVEAREILKAYAGSGMEGVKQLFAEMSDVTVILENFQDLFPGGTPASDISDLLFSLACVMQERESKLSLIFTGSESALEQALMLEDRMRDCFYMVIRIAPYGIEELLALADKLAEELALRIHPDAREKLAGWLEMERLTPDFMNAVSIRRKLLQASDHLARRYYEESDGSEEAMVYLMPEDFEEELPQESLEELLAQVDALTGLRQFKEQLKRQIETEAALKAAQERGRSRGGRGGSMHMVFSGNPGTGKTTAARLTGRIYQQLGLLPKGNITVECSRSDLVGMYQGHTAPLVRSKFREAAGGVLFLDEAYSLCRGDKDDFGHEAVDELMKCMEDYRAGTMVIFAGYTEEMETFLKSNPGFASRIPRQNHIMFEDYTVDEMREIFLDMAHASGYILEEGAEPMLTQLLAVRARDRDFGNARGVRNVFHEVEQVVNSRIVDTMNGFDRMMAADFRKLAGSAIQKEAGLGELLSQLQALTGLPKVKEKIQRTVDRLQVECMERERGVLSQSAPMTLHMVFTGNAGTGKTTVARLIGKIYQKLGVLEYDSFREVGRRDLVGQYQGETAVKVGKAVRGSLGGILFIDEAYNLVNGERDTFGLEAVNTLVQEMENHRGELMVIIAGYTRDMEHFMEANQGMASRFPESGRIFFEDYTDEELMDIFRHMIDGQGYVLEEGLDSLVAEKIAEKRKAVTDFGNARGVRNLVEAAIERRGSRIALRLRQGGRPTDQELKTLSREDFE